MRIVKNLFIKRPMKWQYIISLVLEIPILICFVSNIPQVLLHWGVKISYIIISFIYYIINRGDMKYYFISLSDQLNKKYSPTFWKCFLSSLLTSTKYIFMGFFFQAILQSLFGEIIIPGIGISAYSFPFLVVMCFILSKILFDIARKPPVYLLSYLTIPLFTFSLVGIEKSLLSWTFVSLILISIVPQFISEDIKKILSNNFLENLFGTQQDINSNFEKEFLKLKYKIYIFVPFFYIALIVSEKVIYTNGFNYLFNYIFDRQDDLQNISYFSTTNVIITLIKVFLILYLLIPYFEYSDFIINKIAKFLIMKIERKSGNVEYNGIYNRVSYTKKEWIIDNSDFYSGYKGLFFNNKERCYYLSKNNILISNKKKKIRIKPITEEIFKVEDNYYVSYKSDILKKLSNMKKVDGFRLLNKPDHAVLLFPLTVIIFVLLGAWFF
ncbi:hypothetical protein [Streptococcus sp. IMAU11622]|uniref:hypothetical protein n=1 Tax=Streptococcus sp. IMAU11622 TaxID=3332597 RepID=UPI0035F4472D